MYQEAWRLVVRRLNGVNYLVPIGGDWNKTAELIELDEVAAFIIRALPATIDQIVDQIVEAYDVSRETAFEDASVFLDQLISHGLIKKVAGQ